MAGFGEREREREREGERERKRERERERKREKERERERERESAEIFPFSQSCFSLAGVSEQFQSSDPRHYQRRAGPED